MATRRSTYLPIVLIAGAIVVPSFVLAWLSIRDVDAEQAFLRRLAEERSRAEARTVVDTIEDRVGELEEELIRRIDLDRLREALDQGPEAVGRLLEGRTGSAPVARGVFFADADGRLVHPRVEAPWRSTPPPSPDEIERLLDEATRAEDGGQLLTEAARRLTERRQTRDRLAEAARLEFEEGDPAAAAEIYVDAAGATHDRTLFARAMFGLGRCYARLDRLPDALAAYREAAAVRGARTREGAPIRPLSRLRTVELLARADRPVDSLRAAARLRADLLAGELSVTEEEYHFVSGRTGELADSVRAELGDEAPAAVVRRLDTLEREEARVLSELDVAESVRARLLPDLRRVLETDEGSGLRHIARIGDEPRLVAYLFVRRPDADDPDRAGPSPPRDRAEAGAPGLLGFEVDLAWVRREIVGPILADAGRDGDLRARIVDHAGRSVATSVPPGDDASASPGEEGEVEGGRPVVVDFDPSLFPFWRVQVDTPASRVRALSRRRVTVQIALVGVSLVAIVIGLVLTFRYVRKSLELARLKEGFVSTVSHELRTPLTSIRMFADMLGSDRVPSEERREEYVSIIGAEAERLTRIVDRVLDFARLRDGEGSLEVEPGPVGPIVRRVAEETRDRLEPRGWEVTVDVEDDLPPVPRDPDALEDALRNLLSNAEKYGSEGRVVRCRARRRDDEVVCAVEDEGVGVPAAERERIFEKFHRGAVAEDEAIPGTGLGLTLVRQVVEASGGRVEVESRVGKGSTFRIVLPVAA